MILAFLGTSDDKRIKSMSQTLDKLIRTTALDIAAVLALSDHDAIRTFNPAARFWACVHVLKTTGIDEQKAVCERFCLPADSFKNFTRASLPRLDAKALNYFLPADVFNYFKTNGVK